MNVMKMSTQVLGAAAAHEWIFKKIPSLDNEVPLNLLDTEAGHRLVVQALLQIKHGVYS